MKRPNIDNILESINTAISKGKYSYTGHANHRIKQREVTILEVKEVLLTGHHEKRKDSYDEEWKSWNYSIKGRTIDNRLLRVVLAFDENNMLIITVIDLNK